MINPQKQYGLDVLTRITYELENKEEGILNLQKAIVSDINKMIENMCKETNINKENIYEITVSGNCTMLHMFLGMDARSIGKSPFAYFCEIGLPPTITVTSFLIPSSFNIFITVSIPPMVVVIKVDIQRSFAFVSFTILNVLMDARHVFKIFRKEPEKMQKIFDKFQLEILKFIEEGQRCGANLISFADSAGGVNILGPKMMEQTVQMFTYPFLKKAEKIINDKTILLLCPKTTFALLGTNKAKFYDIELSKPMKYGEGCIEVIGKTKILGQMCIKNINYKLTESKIKGIKLL